MANDERSLPTRRTVLVGGLSGAALVLASACGGSSTGATAQGAANRNATLTIGQPGDLVPKSVVGGLAVDNGFTELIYDRLTRYDHKTLKPRPQLATSWHFSGDGKTLTMKLRNHVKFHTGRPFGPADVIFSIKQVQNPANAAQFRVTAAAITDMTATGPSELALTLAHKISNLFDLFESMPIVDQQTFDELQSGARLVGTGPFMWSTYQAGNQLTMKRNPHYWGARPQLGEVDLRTIAQPQALLASLQAGQTQVALSLSEGQLVGLNKSSVNVVEYDTYGSLYYVGANVKAPPFDRQEVRQALAYAFDRERILKSVYGSVGFASSLPWPKASPAYDAKAAAHYSYNPRKAKAMLSAAGVSNLKVELAVNSARSSDATAAQIVQANLQQVGIDATAKVYDVAQFVATLSGGRFPDLWYNIGGFNNQTPVTMVLSAFPYNTAKNASNFTSDDYTNLANQAWQAEPGADLSGVYSKLNTLLLDEAFVMPLLLTTSVAPVSKKVRNFAYDMGDSIDVRHTSVSSV